MTTTQQHRYEVWAAALLYLTFLVSVATDYALSRGYFAPTHTTSQLFTLYLFTPLTLGIYYYVYRGVRGAKTLFLVLYAFVLYHLLSGELHPTAYNTPLELDSLVAQHGLQVLACILLLLSLRTPIGAAK